MHRRIVAATQASGTDGPSEAGIKNEVLTDEADAAVWQLWPARGSSIRPIRFIRMVPPFLMPALRL